MPVVPFNSNPQTPTRPKPDESFILMAGAMMAAEKQKPIPDAPTVPTKS